MKKILFTVMLIYYMLSASTVLGQHNKYKLLSSQKLDTVGGVKRTQYNIQVPTNMRDEEVKKTLSQAVNELRKKRVVDALSVRLYLQETGSPYAIAYWAPNGDWGKAEKGAPKSSFETSISIYTENRPKASSKVEKHALSLKQRKQIFKEIVQSEMRSTQIATKKYSSDTVKLIKYIDELDKKYAKEICEKYNITKDQRRSIVEEGGENNWPYENAP